MDKDLEELSKEMKDAAAALRKQQTDLQEATRICLDAMQRGVKLDKETQDNIDKAIAKANETGGEVRELAKKVDDLQKSLKDSAQQKPATFRAAIEKAAAEHGADKLAQLAKRDIGSLRFVMKDVNSAAVAGLRPNPYLDTLVSMERQPLRIRDLMTVIPITTDSVRYGQQTVRTNNAATVGEGALKPYSTYAWENRTATVEVIAHLAKMTLQALSDVPRLAGEIESEMRFGLDLEYERQILKGTGSDDDELPGLIDNATPYGNPPAGVTAANILTPVDALRIAILKLHLAYMSPDGHVLNPIDIANIELLRRDPDKGGGYIFGNPDSADPVLRLWRVPTVESPSMDVGRFLTGAFKYSTALYEREGVEVLISTENDKDFERNQATMRCERRSGMAVKRPQGLIYGNFADIT